MLRSPPSISRYADDCGSTSSARDKQAHRGELLPTRPTPEIVGATIDGKPFRLAGLRGQWLLAVAAPGACDAACTRALYATRQARTMQGREMDRVVRVWLVTGVAPPDPAVLAQQPDLVIARVAPAAVDALPGGAESIYVGDPLGNLVFAYPNDPDIKGRGQGCHAAAEGVAHRV